MTARVLDVSVEAYHADPCPTPSLSASLAHTIVSKSPAHAWLEHPRLGGQPRDATKATDLGTIVHELLLGEGPGFTVIAADSYRTKIAQETRDAARAEGRVPVLERELADAIVVSQAITWRLRDLEIDLQAGRNELKIAWCDADPDGAHVHCRSMLDQLNADDAVVRDLKTTSRTAHPTACGRSAADHGLAIQAWAYQKAVGALHPDLVGRVRTEFIFAEIEPPYAVTVGRPDGLMMDLGRAQWERAVATWAWCLRENVWPGYADRVVPLSVPAYALQEEALVNSGFIP